MPAKIGQTRQLFIDSYLIEQRNGIRQVPQEAVKFEGNPILRPEHEWEAAVVINSGGPAVIYDSEASLFKMLYFTYGATFGNGKGLRECFIPSYATSHDGIQWEKPDLGLVEFNGTTNNSILPWPTQMQMGSTNVILDRRDPDPRRRYKSVYYSSRPVIRFEAGPQAVLTWDAHKRDSNVGLFVSFSPDEIKWEDYPGNPVLSSQAVHDTHSLLGWDEQTNRYVGFFRPAFGNTRPSRVRVIGRSESVDFVNWTEPSKQIVLSPDASDPTGTEFYCMGAMFYEDLYLGLLWIYHNDPYWPWPQGTTIADDQLERSQQTIDIQLVTSRDGVRWERTEERTPVIPLGRLGSWDDGMIFASTPLVVGDEVWVYYGGANMRHTGESLGNVGQTVGGVRKTMGVGLAKWRIDGFMAVEPEKTTGSLTTKPLVLDGDRLWVNADASRGQVEVEILSEKSEPIPGYRREDAVPLRAGGVRQQVLWKSKPSSVRSLNAAAVRLKFYIHNAKLYSFGISSS